MIEEIFDESSMYLLVLKFECYNISDENIVGIDGLRTWEDFGGYFGGDYMHLISIKLFFNGYIPD